MTTPNIAYIRSLPAPSAVESTDYQSALQATIASIQQDLPDWSANKDGILYVALEHITYTNTIRDIRLNNVIRQALWAYATGSNLDNLAVNIGVTRLQGETDEQLRIRGPRSLLSASVSTLAGVEARCYDSSIATLFDVQAVVAANKQDITIYAISIDGTDIGATNRTTLQTFMRRPENLTIGKTVTVSTALSQPYTIAATISYDANTTDPIDLEARIRRDVYALIDARRRLNGEVYRSILYDALVVPGVENVVLTSPGIDITKVAGTVPICQKNTTDVALTLTPI